MLQRATLRAYARGRGRRARAKDAKFAGMVGNRTWAAVRRASSVLVLAGGAFALASGCAGKSTDDSAPDPCPSVCENGSKCPGAPPLAESCDDTCLGNDFVATESGCHDLYVASIACSAKLPNVCTALTDCGSQVNAVSTCEHDYCMAHRSDDACAFVP